jgi:hypothetical protein
MALTPLRLREFDQRRLNALASAHTLRLHSLPLAQALADHVGDGSGGLRGWNQGSRRTGTWRAPATRSPERILSPER